MSDGLENIVELQLPIDWRKKSEYRTVISIAI
jgi:hypothetical protein